MILHVLLFDLYLVDRTDKSCIFILIQTLIKLSSSTSPDFSFSILLYSFSCSFWLFDFTEECIFLAINSIYKGSGVKKATPIRDIKA